MNESINSNSLDIKSMLNDLKKQFDKKRFLRDEENVNGKVNQEKAKIYAVLKDYLLQNDINETIVIKPHGGTDQPSFPYTIEVKHPRFSFTIEDGDYILSFATIDNKTKLIYEVRFDDNLDVRWKIEGKCCLFTLEEVIADTFVFLIDEEIKKYHSENNKIPNKDNFKAFYEQY